MSYCRFENTLRDLQDCRHALLNDDTGDMSRRERDSMIALLKLCEQISEEFPADEMAEDEGVDDATQAERLAYGRA